jgi:hypothetical protein
MFVKKAVENTLQDILLLYFEVRCRTVCAEPETCFKVNE